MNTKEFRVKMIKKAQPKSIIAPVKTVSPYILEDFTNAIKHLPEDVQELVFLSVDFERTKRITE